jgi:hypothetical protein
MNYPVRNGEEHRLHETMKTLLHGKRYDECRAFAEQAGQERNFDAVPALMELLKLPSGWWNRRPSVAQCAAREAAVYAIAQIAASDSLSCVGIALFNPCAGVRAAASKVLYDAGGNAADPLIRMLTWKQNWSVEGMRVLIGLLGGSANRNAGPALARIMFGELPAEPPRWSQGVMASITTLTAAEILGLMTLLALMGMDVLAVLPLFLALAVFVAFVNLFIVVPIRHSRHQSERRSLALAACEALRTLGDKKAIPALLTASRRWEPEIASASKASFLHLLPLLRAEDTEWLQLPVRHRLEELLASSDPQVVLTVLQAMEFVGTGSAANQVSRLQSKGMTPEIRAEAVRIAPILQERWHQERVSSTLLRASQSPSEPQQELLRPASAAQATPPEELLRPRQS